MDPEIIIALDIGSTYSGYAYQFSSDFNDNPRDIWMSDSWSGSNSTHKTSTCLLLKCDTLERIAIGEVAERKYLRFLDTGTECSYHLFKNFKMTLYRKDFTTDETPENLKNQVEDQGGRHKPFTLVMSKYIEGLKEDCLERFERYDGQQKERGIWKGQTTGAGSKPVIDGKRIRWVITVPAIWNDFAKHAMRESAVMVCGTVDITAVKVLENGHLEQIMMANGGPWGGQSVNDSFSQLVRDVFITKDGLSSLGSCKRIDLFEMELEFERQKVAIRGKKKDDEQLIKLRLPDEVWSVEKDRILKSERHKYSKYFEITKNGLYFRPDIISEILVNEPLKVILEHLQRILNKEKIRSIETIILVGGLAESHIVQTKIKEALPDRHILVPSKPFVAVLNGAVLYGQKPDIFESRISRFTYGIDTHIQFDPKKHPPEKKKEDNAGNIWCKDVFDIHVKRNQTVSLNEEQLPIVYEPFEGNQTSIVFDIYQTESLNPVYVTDEGCKKIGSLVVEMPDVTKGREKNAQITMIYGDTELGVKGIDVTTGKEFKTTIVYD
ncbi:hypothetical protein ACJMK2_011736 [Sinanodonta woodiana]|uniref:Uncharacterized protein n=1 Tax=Sinanodonta woodiana TaxID=1069815 RepID=A0ABD3V777_SINWO